MPTESQDVSIIDFRDYLPMAVRFTGYGNRVLQIKENESSFSPSSTST